MKKLIIATAALTLVACSKEEKKQDENSGGLSDIVSTAKNYSNINNSMQDVSKNIEALKKMTPLSNDELKALLPELLLGLKRTELSVGENAVMKISSAEAKYKNEENSKRITVEIMDGAGETGSAMVSILMLGLNVEKEKITENGFEKSEVINGMKALVSENKNGDSVDSKIQMVAKNRYIITLNGDGVSYEELKKALEEINLKDLKSI